MNSSRELLCAVSLIPELTTAQRLRLCDLIDKPSRLYSLSVSALQDLSGHRFRRPEHCVHSISELPRRVKRILSICDRRGYELISHWSLRYPPLLREIYDPPFILYLRGRLPRPEQAALAVVGTRRVGEAVLRSAFAFAGECGLSSCPVISGLARGVDRAAHEGALKTSSYTLAVLASGLDWIYPAEHRDLAGRIVASGGGLLSEYPPGTSPLPYRFPQRNRIISGLCRGLVLITAPRRSGALISADFTLEQGRDLFVHRQGEQQEGSAALIEAGATVVDGVADILRGWGWDALFYPSLKAVRPGSDLSISELSRGELEKRIFFYRGSWFEDRIRRYDESA